MSASPINAARRAWLTRSAALTASLTGLPRLAFGAPTAGGWGQLVVVMLRGALDALAAVPAVGDPAWSALRPPGSERAPGNNRDATPLINPLPLDATFALHPELAGLHAWYQRGELLIAHAVASPYRERSHFDAQQLLESGGNRPFELATGWLGRALGAQGGGAIALAEAMPLALRGTEHASTWMPERGGLAVDEDLNARLMAVYAQDAALARTFTLALRQHEQLSGAAEMTAGGQRGAASFAGLAQQAGQFLRAPAATGPAVAWLELGGWDTHNQQVGRLQRQLAQLDQGLVALKAALGEHWQSTSVLVLSEFGRSAAYNGTLGTDHGTGGVAFLAGGAIAGGRVLADWPGLAPSQLHEGRDLRPTRDVRSLLRPLLERHLGVSRSRLDGDILPGSPPGYDGLWRA